MKLTHILLFCFINSLLYGQKDFYPERKDTQNLENYNKYYHSLQKIFQNISFTSGNKNLANVFVNKSSILSLMYAPFDSIDKQLDYAFTFDSIVTCKLLKHFDIEGSFGYKNHYLSYDSLLWKKRCLICETLLENVKKSNTKKYNIDTSLQLQLKTICDLDQKFRHNNLFSKNKSNQKLLDSINLTKIISIIQKYGYPGESLVGDQSMTSFLVIQHANLIIREKYLGIILKAVKEKDLSKNAIVLLLDRIYLNKYNKQIWGTQQFWDEQLNKFVIIPIANDNETIKLKKEIDDL